jgi:hypothetical protein
MKVLGKFEVNGEEQFRFQVGHRLVTVYKTESLVFSCTCGRTWSLKGSKPCKEISEVIEYLKKAGYKQFEV